MVQPLHITSLQIQDCFKGFPHPFVLPASTALEKTHMTKAHTLKAIGEVCKVAYIHE